MKKIWLLVIIAVIGIFSLSAEPTVYMDLGYSYSYDTNVFSDPLVKFASVNWLQWRQNNPYIKRQNSGLHLRSDMFFSQTGRVGISAGVNFGFAHRYSEIYPEGNLSSDWEYNEYDCTEDARTSMFFSFGPTFRAVIGKVDVGMALRASFGSFTEFSDEQLVVGLIAEPYCNVFVTDNMYLTVGGYLDGHLMSFYINNDYNYYRPNYAMISTGAYIGIGMIMGNGRESCYEESETHFDYDTLPACRPVCKS